MVKQIHLDLSAAMLLSQKLPQEPFTALCLYPLLPYPFYSSCFSSKTNTHLLLFFIFKAHCSPFHSEIKGLNEASLAENTLRAHLSLVTKGVVILSYTARLQEAASLALNQRDLHIRASRTHQLDLFVFI